MVEAQVAKILAPHLQKASLHILGNDEISKLFNEKGLNILIS